MGKIKLVSVLLLLLILSPITYAQNNDEPLVIFLFRHAEAETSAEAKDQKNPLLSEAGMQRAETLKSQLKDAKITRIFSTSYNRTQMTVAPIASLLELDVESYNPRDLEGFASELRKMKGRIMVSGHSNTTPELVAFLGGDPGPKLDHTIEYDRLYVLIFSQEQPTTIFMHYGKPAVKK